MLPQLYPGRKLFGQDANSIPTIAAIGIGGSMGRFNRGTDIAFHASRFGQIVAVCDVVEQHTDEFNKKFRGSLKCYTDYRKLLEEVKPDIVTIGTPDHWHVPIAIAALQVGCDVYCEKPLTLTIEEGFRIREAAQSSDRVFQVGTQQRSEFDLLFLKAVAIVRSGRLGDNVNAYIAIGSGDVGGPFEPAAVPEGVNWEMWLGPTPKVDYCDQRRQDFRWFFEYSGGKMTDWGAHHIDIAQWALGLQDTGPVSVSGKGEFTEFVPANFNWDAYLEGKASLPNAFNTATKFNIDLTYASGATISVNHYYEREDGTHFPNGILFEGSKGRIYVNREKLTGKIVEELTDADWESLRTGMKELYGGREPVNHMTNFFECVADRGTPVSDVASHVRTMTSCHLCNINLMLGRDLKWDPLTEKFVGDPAADALVARTSRPGFTM